MSRALTLASLAALASLAPAAAHAQTDAERAQAREAFQAGVEAFGAKRYEEALQSFQEAYRIAPHPSVRVNMANCYEQLGRPVEALDHFERFLIEADSATPAQRTEVRQAIERLRGQIGEVFFRVEPDGATVSIDDGQARTAPILDAVELPVGQHEVVVRLEGHRTVTRTIDVAGGDRAEVRIVLEPGQDEVGGGESLEGAEGLAASGATGDEGEGEGEPEEPPAEDDAGEGFPLNTPTIIAGGATIALAVTAAAFGFSALAANNDFDDAVDRSNDPPLSPAERAAAAADGRDAADRADRRSLVADILGITAVVGAGVTAYFLFFWDDGDDPTATAEGGVDLQAAPTVGPRHGGVVLQGRF